MGFGCQSLRIGTRQALPRQHTFLGVMSIGSVAVSMLFSWLSTRNDLPFGTGALSGGWFGRQQAARSLLFTYPREA
jgi:hypothetical protein